MQKASEVFHGNLERVRALHGLFRSLSNQVTPALDLTDLLRAELVLTVSALDQFVHQLTLTGMLEIWDGQRPLTATYQRFQVPLGDAAVFSSPAAGRSRLEIEIRERHGYLAFQQPDKIADAIRHVSGVDLWKEVGAMIGNSPNDVRAKLRLIVERRNKIAHEADIDPSFPGQRWPISALDVEDTLGFVENVGGAIYRAIWLP